MTAVSTPSTPAAAPIFASRTRSRLRTRLALAGLSACGLAALAWTFFMQPLPRLIYNPSDSVAIGWYRIKPFNHDADLLPRPLSAGDIILTRLPPDAAALAAQRGYLPTHIPLLKRVGAVASQHVCIVDDSVHIDGAPVAAILPADRLGRPLPVWPQCRRLQSGELFLLSATHPASFDSRYFGPVNVYAVIGIAHPVWVETRP